jgi:hypothetical protein
MLFLLIRIFWLIIRVPKNMDIEWQKYGQKIWIEHSKIWRKIWK